MKQCVNIFSFRCRQLVNMSSTKNPTTLQLDRNTRRDTLQAMINGNNSNVRLEDVPSIVTDKWSFKLIFVNGLQQDMAICTVCLKLEFINDELQNHQCARVQLTPTIALPSPNELQRTSTIDKYQRELIKQQLAFSFAELFPLEGFNDMGFRTLTNYLLNVGAKYGKVKVNDLLGDKKTLENERRSLVYMVKVYLKKIVAQEKLVFSCDTWHDPEHLKRCITLWIHYIDENFVLQRNVLGTRIYNDSEFDGEKLSDYVIDVLGEYTSTPATILSTATIVTSKTSDFSKSFQNYGRMNCMCTILNEVANKTLALPLLETENMCKAIIGQLKRQFPNQNYNFAVTNYQLNDWFSIWNLFDAYQHMIGGKSIIQNYEILHSFVTEFQKASKLLSSTNEATISTVYLVKQKLIDVLRVWNVGSLKLTQYKDEITSFVRNTFEITDIHMITLFLDPRYKSLKFLTKAEREALHTTVRGIIGESFIPDDTLKKLRNLGNHVCWVDVNGVAEVDNYLNLMNISPDTNVLEFWKQRVDFPKLRNLAKEMLCIPATSAAWECYFNKDKFNLSRRRLQLDLNELDTTLLLNGHIRYGLFDEQLKILFGS